jgi:hypothetical protein
MLEERVVYLINADIDGELGSDETAELASVLAESAEARNLQAELRRLAALVESLPPQEPPAELASHILENLHLSAAAARRPGPANTFSLGNFLASFQPARMGLAFAAGLLLTVGFYQVSDQDAASMDTTGMVGTMVANPSAQSGLKQDSITISQPALSGTVSLSQVGQFLALNIDLDMATKTEIEVEIAKAGLGLGGIAHAADYGNASDETYEVSGGTLRVVSMGRHSTVIVLTPSEPEKDGQQALGLKLSQSGNKVFEGSLRLGSS